MVVFLLPWPSRCPKYLSSHIPDGPRATRWLPLLPLIGLNFVESPGPDRLQRAKRTTFTISICEFLFGFQAFSSFDLQHVDISALHAHHIASDCRSRRWSRRDSSQCSPPSETVWYELFPERPETRNVLTLDLAGRIKSLDSPVAPRKVFCTGFLFKLLPHFLCLLSSACFCTNKASCCATMSRVEERGTSLFL